MSTHSLDLRTRSYFSKRPQTPKSSRKDRPSIGGSYLSSEESVAGDDHDLHLCTRLKSKKIILLRTSSHFQPCQQPQYRALRCPMPSYLTLASGIIAYRRAPGPSSKIASSLPLASMLSLHLSALGKLGAVLAAQHWKISLALKEASSSCKFCRCAGCSISRPDTK